jgi:predicted MPP superfamily phosphohydrolase
MPLFLITFISIYGGIHLLAFKKLQTAFSPGRPVTIALIIWMLAMTFAPLLVRLFERAGMDLLALITAWPGFVWMGFIFIFVSVLFFIDLTRIVFWLSHFVCPAPDHAFLTSRVTITCALLLSFTASAYAWYEANFIRSEQVIINTSKLPPDVQKIRIVQVSDVHVGMLFREERLEQVLKIVREAKPDIFVSTGDLVDGKLNREDVIAHQNKMAAMLASVDAPAGKYAVTGNHEFYAGLNEALAFTSAAGFKILRNQTLQMPNGMLVTGIDDQVAMGGKNNAHLAEKSVLDKTAKSGFHLLLKHRPEIPATSDGHFDLQLSGHVHNGQIFPFNFLVLFKYPIPCGTTTTKAGSNIHVSRGTGTWGPPLRLFAPPEVTIIDIVPNNRS